MSAIELQTAFFKKIKECIPPHRSMVEDLSELLNISNDSAYRRIRGEKFLTFDEIEALSSHFKISLDSFLQLQNGALLFTGKNIDGAGFTFDSYLQDIINQLSFFNSAQQKQMISLHKDIPIFHHFSFPELAAFKCYFWNRYNLNNSHFNKTQFLIDDHVEAFTGKGTKIYDLYQKIPSTEIWNADCINTTIRQIDYYRETKVFRSQADIVTIYNCLENVVSQIEQQIELGCKFRQGGKENEIYAKYHVYINDFILGDNTILVVMDNSKMVFLNHNVLNYIMTTNKEFVDYTYNTLQTLLKKSSLISEIGEKDRIRFFEALREKIHEKRKLV